ncbi:thiamine pyrophosphate-binding protein [Corynebacterium bovis]|uniref:thiamine pyrophosphate-binding protein n=1 Tax=Corynebacterium bovis TaxID=36808 RepID=UPI0031397A0F
MKTTTTPGRQDPGHGPDHQTTDQHDLHDRHDRTDGAPAPATVSDAVAAVIRERADHVFGVVGNGNIHLVSALTSAGFPYTAARHEAGAVTMADAFTRAGGGVAVATTTYGPGFTNALTPLTELVNARIPVVYVVSDIPSDGPRPIDVDQRAITAALGVTVVTATPTNATAAAERAFTVAARSRGPVVLFIHYDHVAAPLAADPEPVTDPGPVPPATAPSEDAQPASAFRGEETDTAAVARLLTGARRPLILAGRGVVESGTAADVLALGDELGALFVTSAMARHVVDSGWSLGICGGFLHSGYRRTVADADVVLVLGAGLNSFQSVLGTIFGPTARVVVVDHVRRPTPVAVTDRLTGDLRDLVPELLDACRGEAASDRGRTWRETLGELPVAESDELDPGCLEETAADGLLDPRHVMRRLDALLPAERTVTTDGGHFLGWVPPYIDCPDPHGTVLVGTAIMTIGLGLAAASGASVARPDRFTVGLCGDGGSLMGFADLETFFRVTRRGVLVIVDDGAYGAEVHQYVREGLDEAPMLLGGVDFSRIGAPFGVPGLTVDRPGQLADDGEVAQFLAEHGDGVSVLHIRISRQVVAAFLREDFGGDAEDDGTAATDPEPQAR